MEAPLSPPLKAPERKPQRPPSATGWPGIPIGRILGIDIRIDPSWLIIFALVVFSMFGYFAQSFPEARTGALGVAAFATTAVFFFCLLLHEISHSLVARTKGVEVLGITLFMFGGVSQLRDEPKRPSDEFTIAIVGPITSAVLGMLFLAVRQAFSPATLMFEAFGWLGRINVALAVFNLLPGFPLDGGRMLRAAVWGATKDLRQATRVASLMGSVIAFGLVGLGIVTVLFRGRFIDGLWLGLIGWFLLVAARQSVGQVELKDSLKRLLVRQGMRPGCPQVPENLLLDHFVDEHVFRGGGKCFFVTEGEVLKGLVTLDEVRRVNRDEWSRTRLGDVMIPFTEIKSVTPSDSLLTAYELMNEHSLNQLPVVDDGRVVGMITRNDIFGLVAKFLELTGQPGRT